MLVLVATKEMQIAHHDESGDYSYTVDGELVTPVAAECGSPERCGCDRGFPGLASNRATTTAQVVNLEHITADDLRDVIDGVLERDGWFDLIDEHERHELIDEHMECIAAVCAAFPVGTIVGRHGALVYDRSIAQAA